MENKRLISTGVFRALPPGAENNRRAVFAISDESRDRHGTIIPLKAWDLKSFKKNPVVFYMHEGYGGNGFQPPDPDMLIGRAISIGIIAGELQATIEFEPAEINPLAKKVWQKILFGSLKSTSVGFIETAPGYYGEGDEARRGENETYYYSKVELLEISIVNIPSNKNAGKRIADLSPVARRYTGKILGEVRPPKLDELTEEDVAILLEGKKLGFKYTDPAEMRYEVEWHHRKETYKRLAIARGFPHGYGKDSSFPYHD